MVDALSELANIGAGNASTRLEKALKEKVAKNLYGNSAEITPQLIEFCHLSNIELRFPKTTHTAFYTLLNIDGSSAMISVFFSMESALFISGLLQAKQKHYEVLQEDDEKTLQEIANAVIDSYVDSSAQFLNLPILHTETKKAYLNPISIPDFVKESIGEKTDIALLFKTDFSIRNTSFKGDLKIVLSLLELDPIVNAIKKNLGIEVTAADSAKAPEGHSIFHLFGGGTMKSLEDLDKALESMHDFTFHHHITPFRNDFAAWVYDVFREKDLALKMGSEKTRDGMKRILDEFLSQKKIYK